MSKHGKEKTILFINDRDVMYRGGTRRVLHPLQRHPDNPLVVGRENDWEVALAYNSVHRDADTGKYQMWYQAGALGAAVDRAHQCVVCYAESDDGIHWIKPQLGIHRFNKIEHTNIVLIGSGVGSRYGSSVVVDPGNSGDRKYKIVYYDHGRDADGGVCAGMFIAFSPDGIHWTKHSDTPVLTYWGADYGEAIPFADEARPGVGVLRPSDALDAIYDPQIDAYALYAKIWLNTPEGTFGWKRGVGRVTSEDFVHWSELEVLLYPDELDPPGMEMHHAPVFYYGGYYFGLMQRTDPQVRGGIMDIELVLGEDGRNFARPFRDVMFLPLGQGGERDWDGGSIFSNATPVVLEDEIRYYYGGYSQGTLTADDTRHISGVGLASMPRDRFAGLRPSEYSGVVSLKPMELNRYREICINAELIQGQILCEIVDRNGYRVRGYAQEDAVPLTVETLFRCGSGLSIPVEWKEKNISELPPGEYLLQIYLKNAEVFAVSFRE